MNTGRNTTYNNQFITHNGVCEHNEIEYTSVWMACVSGHRCVEPTTHSCELERQTIKLIRMKYGKSPALRLGLPHWFAREERERELLDADCFLGGEEVLRQPLEMRLHINSSKIYRAFIERRHSPLNRWSFELISLLFMHSIFATREWHARNGNPWQVLRCCNLSPQMLNYPVEFVSFNWNAYCVKSRRLLMRLLFYFMLYYYVMNNSLTECYKAGSIEKFNNETIWTAAAFYSQPVNSCATHCLCRFKRGKLIARHPIARTRTVAHVNPIRNLASLDYWKFSACNLHKLNMSKACAPIYTIIHS